MASSNETERPLDQSPEHAISDRNISVTLVGTTLGILTFLLFFLYPRASAGGIDQFSFQALVTLVISAMFPFSFSGLYTYLYPLFQLQKFIANGGTHSSPWPCPSCHWNLHSFCPSVASANQKILNDPRCISLGQRIGLRAPT
jgi:hypothetical protein